MTRKAMPSRRGEVYEFGPFRLEPGERRLLRDGRPVALRAKLFDTLRVLVESHGKLIGKDELLKAVWPDRIVEENNLAHNISVLRKTLGDHADGQRYIETAPAQGYRFVADVVESRRALPAAWHAAAEPPGRIAGRRAEMERLERALAKAEGGARQLVFVTGEAGAGKTLLVNVFAQRPRGLRLLYAHGQCLEHRGEGEAYMPLLEALGRLCRETGGEELIALLARFAPTWLVQMPWLLSESEFAAARRRTAGATRERMLREMVETLEMLAAGRPVLLVLEDLHWSDDSTVELLECVARRREPARILLIGTCRIADVKVSGHPVYGLAQDLRVRGYCDEVALGFLSRDAIEEYLEWRFEDRALAAELAPVVRRRTEGNPLFMVNVVDHWIALGLLARDEGAWRRAAPAERLAAVLPETLRELIERQLDSLGPEDREMLEAGAAVGRSFAAVTVAAALEAAADDVEARCGRMVRQGQFLTGGAPAEGPDGEVSTRYTFIHDLHREVLYGRVPAGRAAKLHRRIGALLETAYGARAPLAAAELADHFVRGRDASSAVLYLRHAAEQALARSAHRKAIDHARAGLRLLRTMPASRERDAHELVLNGVLARALTVAEGWAAPEARAAYLRARRLSAALGNPPELASPVLLGLATLLEVRGEYRESQAMIEERLRLSSAEHALESHELMGCSLFHQGRFELALEHAGRGLELHEPGGRYWLLACHGDDPVVSCLGWSGLSLWFLGFPDQALERVREGLKHAAGRAHAQASARNYAALVHLYRREPRHAARLAAEAAGIAREQGFPYREAIAVILHGWATAMTSGSSEGQAELRRGLATCRALGAAMDDAFYLALLAEALTASGQAEEALYSLEEALGFVRPGRTFFYEPELHRLWGDTLLAAGVRDESAAEASFHRAIETARRQKAVSLELRAAISLARMSGRRRNREEARRLLEPLRAVFVEGFDTADLRTAARLLGPSARRITAG